MKKYYKSPEFEVMRVILSDMVLVISEGEVATTPTGFIEEPGDDMIEDF